MAYIKGKKVEQGIWRRADGPGYIVEVNHLETRAGPGPQERKVIRIRERRTIVLLNDARKWLRARKAVGIRGEIEAKRQRPRRVPFNEFADEYLTAWRQNRKPSTVNREELRIKGTLKPAFGKKTIEDYLTKRLDSGISAAIASRELCRLKNMLLYHPERTICYHSDRLRPSTG